jgi:serine/threonine protein kinase
VIFNDAVSPAVDIWAMACIFFRLFQDEMLCTKASSGNIADEMIFNIVSTSDKLPERWWGMWQNWNGRRRRCLLPSKEQQVQWLRKLELKDSCMALMLDMLKLEPGERICAAEVVARFPVEWLLAIEDAPEFCAPPEAPPSQEERDQMELKNTECKRMVQEIQEDPAYGPEGPPCQQRQHQMGPLQGQLYPQNAPPVMQPQATHEQLYPSPDNHPEADGDHYTEMLQNSCLFE